ncbi:hypothetical protein OIU74_000015, partial [Salix koriyanagi]
MCEEALRSKDAQILRCHSLSLTCCNYNSEFDSHDPVRLVSVNFGKFLFIFYNLLIFWSNLSTSRCYCL